MVESRMGRGGVTQDTRDLIQAHREALEPCWLVRDVLPCGKGAFLPVHCLAVSLEVDCPQGGDVALGQRQFLEQDSAESQQQPLLEW